MPDPPPFVDIHCHLLPEMDDGAADWDETLAMARLAVDDGISTIVVTPHQLGSNSHNDGDAIRAKTVQLQQFLHQRNVPLHVLPGADVRIEPDLLGKIRSGKVLTLADRHRHLLLELPHEVYLPIERFLDTLNTAGIVGILSHPERNQGILSRRNVLRPLVEAGCLLQVTASSLVGSFGPEVQQFANWLVQQQLVHFVSTDAHGMRSRRPLLRRAFDCVARLAGNETAIDLCCRHPALVAAGKTITPTRSPPVDSGLIGWFRRKKAG